MWSDRIQYESRDKGPGVGEMDRTTGTSISNVLFLLLTTVLVSHKIVQTSTHLPSFKMRFFSLTRVNDTIFHCYFYLSRYICCISIFLLYYYLFVTYRYISMNFNIFQNTRNISINSNILYYIINIFFYVFYFDIFKLKKKKNEF